MADWLKVVFASDCRECEECGDTICPVCEIHYANCECPGPTQDDEFEYEERADGLYARRLPDA